MTARVCINAHVKFKITRFRLNDHIEVPRFKITIEYKWLCAESHRLQMWISLKIWIHPSKGSLSLSLVLVQEGIDNTVLWWKAHVISWDRVVSPSRVFKI